MTDRDPLNPAILGAAVAAWAGTEPGDHEADAVLERELIDQGVMRPDEAIQSLTGDDPLSVTVVLESGDVLRIDINGNVRRA